VVVVVVVVVSLSLCRRRGFELFFVYMLSLVPAGVAG
jgi:hypothetical protein